MSTFDRPHIAGKNESSLEEALVEQLQEANKRIEAAKQKNDQQVGAALMSQVRILPIFSSGCGPPTSWENFLKR